MKNIVIWSNIALQDSRNPTLSNSTHAIKLISTTCQNKFGNWVCGNGRKGICTKDAIEVFTTYKNNLILNIGNATIPILFTETRLDDIWMRGWRAKVKWSRIQGNIYDGWLNGSDPNLYSHMLGRAEAGGENFFELGPKNMICFFIHCL